MSEIDDLISEANQDLEKSKSFGSQFSAGFERSASFGYNGDEMPEKLPLSGRVGRIAGDIAGFVPFAESAAGMGAAAGLGKIASEAASGGLYGLISKPEEGESRLKNALKDAALFGGGAAVLRGVGKLAGRGGVDAVEGVEKNAENIRPGEIQSPADLEMAVARPGQSTFDSSEGTASKELAIPEIGNVHSGEMMGDFPPEALQNPEAFGKVMEVKAWDKMVKPWAENILRIGEDTTPMAMAEFGNVEAAAKLATEQAGMKNLGLEGPVIDMSKDMRGNWSAQWDTQKTIDDLIKKNGLSAGDIQQAVRVKEPINFLMSKGANFEDASDLLDSIVDRVGPSMGVARPPEILSVADAPTFESLKTRSLTPDEVFDMFFNVPIKGPEAIKYGLAVPGPAGQMKLTEAGYDFLRKYNPEFGIPLAEPIKGLESLDRKALGAIRGQGYSNLDLTEKDLKDAGFHVPLKKALSSDFLRPGKTEGTYQLTQKGSGMLAGGRGFNANVDLKSYDVAAGRRVVPGDTEGIAKLKAANKRTDRLFKDLWEEVTNIASKGCDH